MKSTSTNEWFFDEGCEKLPSAVILAFFTGTFLSRNDVHALQPYISLFNIMMPVRLCFENKKTLSYSFTKEKNNYSNRFEFGFFPPYFDGTLFVFILLRK